MSKINVFKIFSIRLVSRIISIAIYWLVFKAFDLSLTNLIK